jgi:hypothetical protein
MWAKEGEPECPDTGQICKVISLIMIPTSTTTALQVMVRQLADDVVYRVLAKTTGPNHLPVAPEVALSKVAGEVASSPQVDDEEDYLIRDYFNVGPDGAIPWGDDGSWGGQGSESESHRRTTLSSLADHWASRDERFSAVTG